MPRHPTRRIGTTDAAEAIGVTRQRVQQLAESGELPAERVGRRGTRVFDAEVVHRFAGRRDSGAFQRLLDAERAKGAEASAKLDRWIAAGGLKPMGMRASELRRRADERRRRGGR